ncbi:ig-like domain-containing protein [Trichonephila inaurata madagascariensis]|uniref:Ig-like domain-containing protein n=1 Tax=Trichonephila inaurata madagascariensis TaxID=2747483 RepID=A0A8X6WNK6_9ARAC|nr:ig-like domain-containing protein [Trichonephila inaurata madagascariensis]
MCYCKYRMPGFLEINRTVLGGRARFNLSPQRPSAASLTLENVQKDDAGEYRCRVDFRRGRTLSWLVKLNVIVPTNSLVIKDKENKTLTGTIGPYKEGSSLTLVCEAQGVNDTHCLFQTLKKVIYTFLNLVIESLDMITFLEAYILEKIASHFHLFISMEYLPTILPENSTQYSYAGTYQAALPSFKASRTENLRDVKLPQNFRIMAPKRGFELISSTVPTYNRHD